jgi:hypothetical protein
MFLPERSMSIGERVVTVPGSTARLTTGEMMDYIDDALRAPASWAALCRPQRRRDLFATRPQPQSTAEYEIHSKIAS